MITNLATSVKVSMRIGGQRERSATQMPARITVVSIDKQRRIHYQS